MEIRASVIYVERPYHILCICFLNGIGHREDIGLLSSESQHELQEASGFVKIPAPKQLRPTWPLKHQIKDIPTTPHLKRPREFS